MALRDLSYGQLRILKLFEGGNHDMIFIPHDPFEMRICGALSARELLKPITHDGFRGFELTGAGRAALQSQGPTP